MLICMREHVYTTLQEPVKCVPHHLIIMTQKYKVISLTYNTLQTSKPSYLRQLFTIQPPRSTRSLSTLPLPRPSVTSSLIFSNRSIAIAVPPLWKPLRHHCDKYLTHPTSSF